MRLRNYIMLCINLVVMKIKKCVEWKLIVNVVKLWFFERVIE